MREAEIAREAQKEWALRPLDRRLRVVRALRHRIAGHAGELAAAARAGRERPEAEVISSEIIPLADACRFLEREAPGLLAPRLLGRDGLPFWLRRVEAEVRREPLGLVLILAPASYPLFLPGVQTIQALAAGNAVLLKPGRGGLPAARALAGLLASAGLDENLLQVLPESPETAREAIAARPDKVLLTGSAATGRKVLAELAAGLVPATAELSGCDALFVLPGADLDRVARAVRFGLELNGGATCIAPRRVFVPRDLARPLEDRLRTLVSRLPETALDGETTLRVRALVADALARGARLLAGGTGPQILLDASPGMEILRSDLSAPVVSVVGVSTRREALSAAAGCPYALGASVFGPEEEARELAAEVRAGVVVVNDVIVPTADPRLPFGGRGESGFGVTRGAEGLLDLTAVKVISVRRGRWLPHLEERRVEDGELLRGYLRAAHSEGSWRRAGGFAIMLRAALRRRRHRAVPSPGVGEGASGLEKVL